MVEAQTNWESVTGSDLRVDDTIEVWFGAGRRDRIVSLKPYRGPLTCFEPEGAQIAVFATSNVGMTIENGSLYRRVTSAKAEGRTP